MSFKPTSSTACTACFIQQSITIANRSGDNRQPCRTPEHTSNQSLSVDPRHLYNRLASPADYVLHGMDCRRTSPFLRFLRPSWLAWLAYGQHGYVQRGSPCRRADVGTGQKLGQRDRQGEHITRPIQAMLHTGCGGIKTKQTLKFSLSNK